ncbi:MAG: M48 family metallopeptidase [Leptolinea sp.]|nr:M48 family metallopeptidase [Leptolinea sp.]
MAQILKPSKSIRLGEGYIPYIVRFSKRASRWRLSVTADKVEVVLPEGSRLHPEKLLRDYSEWIIEKQQKLTKRKERLEKKSLPEGQILLMGRPMLLEIKDAGKLGRQQVAHLPGRIQVLAGKSKPTSLLQKWLANQAEAMIIKQVRMRAVEMGVRPTSLSIRNQRTRWGSCSLKGSLSFNWRLIMAPPEVLDYVVVHELAHMKEHNHSKAFWAVVHRYCPDYVKHRTWLKQNQAAMWPGLFEG